MSKVCSLYAQALGMDTRQVAADEKAMKAAAIVDEVCDRIGLSPNGHPSVAILKAVIYKTLEDNTKEKPDAAKPARGSRKSNMGNS